MLEKVNWEIPHRFRSILLMHELKSIMLLMYDTDHASEIHQSSPHYYILTGKIFEFYDKIDTIEVTRLKWLCKFINPKAYHMALNDPSYTERLVLIKEEAKHKHLLGYTCSLHTRKYE